MWDTELPPPAYLPPIGRRWRLALARRAHGVVPGAGVVGLGVAPKAGASVLVSTCGRHVGASAVVGETAATVGTRTRRAERTRVASHDNLL